MYSFPRSIQESEDLIDGVELVEQIDYETEEGFTVNSVFLFANV